MAELHLVRDVLDSLLCDKQGRDCGRVDSIVVELRRDGPAVATHIEVGLFIALRRVSAPMAKWLERSASWLPVPLDTVKFSLERFSHQGHIIELPVDSEADSHLMRTEKWLRRHVVERIPGGKGKGA